MRCPITPKDIMAYYSTPCWSKFGPIWIGDTNSTNSNSYYNTRILSIIPFSKSKTGKQNIENMREQSQNFFGIPSPAAAGIALIPFFLNFISFDFIELNTVLISSILVIYAGAMMISRVPTPSFKNIKLSPLYMRLITILVIIILIFLITYFWQTTFFLAAIYLIMSVINLFIYFLRILRFIA